jgi:protease I
MEVIMGSKSLKGLRVAAIVADGFEQVELTVPKSRLEEEGADVEVISLRPGSVQGMNLLFRGKSVHVDRTIFTARAGDYDALLQPGGFISPDFLRQSERVLEFVREIDRAGKPIAVICHGPWVLVSAGLVRGRRLASWPGIKDDVQNAGGMWEDSAMVRDRNWVSSRSPLDLKQFNDGLVELFGERMPAIPAETVETGSQLPRWALWGGAGAMVAAAAAYGVAKRGMSSRHAGTSAP